MSEKPQEIDAETRFLASMAYAEGSAKNDPDEFFAIASVLVRQRNARGHKEMMTFAKKEPTYSYVVKDGNPRFAQFNKAKEEAILKDKGMSAALDAAKNALAGGEDKSNGAFFWDGLDIKTNYSRHFKVRHGIRFSDSAHNIYDIKESSKLVIKFKNQKIKENGKVRIVKEEIYRYDHIYESTAAHGGTIFWKMSPEYIKLTHAKEHR